MKTHKDLNVWRESISLVTLIYEKTKSFPKDELFALTSQIRRSAISIPSNIAEGAARESSKEDYVQISEKLVAIKKMLAGLIKFRKTKSI
jgi:hypothetical protein